MASLAFHYTALGLNPIVEGNMVRGEVTTPVFIKNESFEPGFDIKEDEDRGNIGGPTTFLGTDRVDTDTGPTINDKCRFKEGLEDWTWLLYGAYDAPVPAVANALIAKKMRFYKDVLNPTDLRLATIKNGYNYKTAKAETYIEAAVNSIKYTLNPDKAPSITVSTISNAPKFNQTEPTIVLPSEEFKLKSRQGTVYMGNVGDNLATLKNSANILDCYNKLDLESSNNIDATVCGGTAYGTKQKDAQDFTTKGEIEMNYNDYNMWLEALWATGANDGVDVSQESVYRQILIEFIGKTIETVESVPVRMSKQILIPKAKIGPVKTPKSGKEKKTVNMNFEAVADGLTSPVEVTMVTPLADLHWGTQV